MLIAKPNKDREEHDFYSTPPKLLDYLLEIEEFDKNIWEPCCGDGALVNRLRKKGYNVKASDLIYRGCPDSEVSDFLDYYEPFDGDIITSPPFKNVLSIVKQAYDLSKRKIAMFLNVHFIQGQVRYNFFL